MASVEVQNPSCPVCHQADQVKTTEAAYDSGVARCAPPDMPTKTVSMFRPTAICIVLVGICAFLIVVLFGSGADLPIAFQLSFVVLTVLIIVATLVVSYMSFQRVVKGDAEVTERLPAWDQAMNVWRGLYYCSRDDVATP